MALFKRSKKQNNESDKALRNPKILEVNLIKEEAQLTFNWKRNIKPLIFALGVTIFVIIELYLGLDWWQQDEEARLRQIKNEIKQVKQDVEDIRNSVPDALAYKEKTEEVKFLLENHVYWTNFFSWLEKNTLSTVSFDGFSGDLEGEYKLAGVAGSFAEVSWQANKISESEFVDDVEILTASFGQEESKEDLEEEAQAGENQEEEEVSDEPQLPPGVAFELTLEMNPKIFIK